MRVDPGRSEDQESIKLLCRGDFMEQQYLPLDMASLRQVEIVLLRLKLTFESSLEFLSMSGSIMNISRYLCNGNEDNDV